jgi:hypothetical protein
MSSFRLVPVLIAVGLLSLVGSGTVAAQQAAVGTPFRGAGDSFYERFGVGWGVNTRGLAFSFGSPNMGVPPFGNFDPSAGLNTSFHFGQPGNGGFFNLSAGQGFRQNLVTQAPSVTVMNGQTGYVADASLSPFVMGYVPVVGGFYPVGGLYPIFPVPPPVCPGYPVIDPAAAPGAENSRVQQMWRAMAERNAERNGVAGSSPPPHAPPAQPGNPQQRPADAPVPDQAALTAGEAVDAAAGRLAAVQASSAGQAVPSVAEARRLHELEQAAEGQQAALLFEKARAAEDGGKPNVARIYYQMVAGRASGELKQQALARVAALGGERPPANPAAESHVKEL